MEKVKGGEGVYEYEAICDETNNPPEVLDTNKLIVDLYIKPTRVAEYMYLQTTILDSGIKMSELIQKNPF